MKKACICFEAVLTFFLFGKVYALDSISVDNLDLSPRFEKQITKYNVYVDDDKTEININATLSEDEIEVIGLGNYNITDGVNTYEIKAINKNNNITKYEINVYKNYQKNNYINSSKLLNLRIDGYEIDFNPNTLDYYVNIDYEENLNVHYETEDDDAKVILTGNENLKYGNNKIIITVYSMDNESKTIYTIFVNKLKQVFNNINTNNKTENLVISSSQRSIIKTAIVIITLVLEIIFYKIIFIRKKS